MVVCMKRVLIVTTISGFLPQFEMDNVELLQELGYEVHYASNFMVPVYEYDKDVFKNKNIIKHHIDFVRSPYAIAKNIKVYYQLKNLLNTISFDLIHCHTPMGGVMARLVSKKNYKGKIIYTAHGFHFFKGAPLKNWLLYYPIEKYLSRNTDYLITINKEDYRRARKNFHARNTVYVPGVGIHCNKINNIVVNKQKKLKELNIPENCNIVLSVGELIKRKNYDVALEAFASAKLENTVYVICGDGVCCNELKMKTRKLNIENRVFFLGYRKDVCDIMKCADVFFFPSKQEGLSVALMEAMAAGLPIVCSYIRGNVDLIQNSEGGLMCHPMDVKAFSEALSKILSNPDLAKKMRDSNRQAIASYDKSYIRKMMERIYRNI